MTERNSGDPAKTQLFTLNDTARLRWGRQPNATIVFTNPDMQPTRRTRRRNMVRMTKRLES